MVQDFYEIDFLAVEAKKSGDAIAIRYRLGGRLYTHIVDGGYQSTGTALCQHVKQFYDNISYIDHVVATHNDHDHARGLIEVLETFDVGALWMLRPWLYADALIHQFATYNSVDRLASALRSAYSNLAALEEVANRRGIPICEPFQGSRIGAFTVMAPTRARYFDLIVSSNKTPAAAVQDASMRGMWGGIVAATINVVNLVRASWGEEAFPADDTSNENEMSVVQYARLSNHSILLTADTGRQGLQEVIDFAPYVSLSLPGIDRFQVPHHGGRRNVNSDLLDKIVGRRLASQPVNGHFLAITSSAKDDEHHPKKVVKRALMHRGANFYATEGVSIHVSGGAVPPRTGWAPMQPEAYPDTYEE